MIPGLEISPGEGNGNPLQYSCLKKPIDRGAWKATAHWVAKSLAQLSDQTTTKGCSYPWLMSSLHLQSQQWPVKSFSCYSALTLTLLPSEIPWLNCSNKKLTVLVQKPSCPKACLLSMVLLSAFSSSSGHGGG